MKKRADSFYNIYMMTSIKRVIRLGWISLSRDGGVIVTTIFVLVLTIALITSIFMIKGIGGFIISSIEEKVDISVYFKENVKEDEIMDMKEKIYSVSEPENIQYVSREQALDDFMERHQEEPVLMQSLEEVGVNPFLASLNIQASDPGQYEKITKFLEGAEFKESIEKVDYYQRKPVIERIFSLTNSLKQIGIVLSVLLVFFSVLVVLNTTRLAIYNLKEEIQVQRLVGASDWFIRGPFLVQGIGAGIVAALICFILFAFGSWAFSSNINALFGDLDVWKYFTDNLLSIMMIQLLTGIVLGIGSSLIAVRKYLKI